MLGLGLVQVGGKHSFYPDRDLTEYKNILRKAIDNNIRSFDSATSYPNADSLLYSVLKEKHLQREEYDICQKIMPSENFIEKAETSLKQLHIDYFDSLLIHWPTRDRKILFSTFKALEKLKESGKAINIGVSNFPSYLLENIADDFEINLLEIPFSLIWTKDVESAKILANERGAKLYTYAPLGFGLLSGKYRTKESLEDNRKSLWVYREPAYSYFISLLDEVEAMSKKYNVTNAQIALSVVNAFHFDKTFIGINKLNQLDIFSSNLTLEENDLVSLFTKALHLTSCNNSDNIYQHRW